MLFKGWRMMLFLTGLKSSIYLVCPKGDWESWQSILLKGSVRGTHQLMQRQEEGSDVALHRAFFHASAHVLHSTTARDMVRVCDQLSGEKNTRFKSLFCRKRHNKNSSLSTKTRWDQMIIWQVLLIMKEICHWSKLKRTVDLPNLDTLKSKLIIWETDRSWREGTRKNFKDRWEEKAVFGCQMRRNGIS